MDKGMGGVGTVPESNNCIGFHGMFGCAARMARIVD